ncbi:TM0996/MTH895 family glutaredoxin-like protein [bacterium]|nr:TM0996/MTH895 family glutaredoxin-like protein [bacterium]
MKIEVLGTGCPKCKKLTEQAEEAVKELGISAEIVKVTDINEIMKYDVMVTPALVVNGEVKVSGRIPNIEEVKEWLK